MTFEFTRFTVFDLSMWAKIFHSVIDTAYLYSEKIGFSFFVDESGTQVLEISLGQKTSDLNSEYLINVLQGMGGRMITEEKR